MSEISIIGLDLAKQVFRFTPPMTKAAASSANSSKAGAFTVFAGLGPCVVATEACGSAHLWAREIDKLGHAVRLLPPLTSFR